MSETYVFPDVPVDELRALFTKQDRRGVNRVTVLCAECGTVIEAGGTTTKWSMCGPCGSRLDV